MGETKKDKILIVDDDMGVLKLLLRTLQEQYAVFVAPSGYDIESVIHQFKPDLMILDIGLPDESGRDLCSSLRKRSDYDSMAILFLSGRSAPEVAAACIQAGADGYLTKPFDVHILRSTITHLIESKRSQLTA